MQYIFLSHDVDWSKAGPSREHIFARKDRFEEKTLKDVDKKNPYYNFPELMEIEEKFNVKSTFFFRTKYETGSINEYEDEIKELIKNDLEVGLHSDPSSITDLNELNNEKKLLEEITKKPIFGNRVHFLKFDEDLPRKLSRLGFIYDSSIKNSKNRIDEKDIGFHIIEKIIELPITIMDAYLFTFMNASEENLLTYFDKTLNLVRNTDAELKIWTILWHDNVLKMKGGRMYGKILEYLTSQDDVIIEKGFDIVKRIK